jgi:hypothetical protein
MFATGVRVLVLEPRGGKETVVRTERQGVVVIQVEFADLGMIEEGVEDFSGRRDASDGGDGGRGGREGIVFVAVQGELHVRMMMMSGRVVGFRRVSLFSFPTPVTRMGMEWHETADRFQPLVRGSGG